MLNTYASISFNVDTIYIKKRLFASLRSSLEFTLALALALASDKVTWVVEEPSWLWSVCDKDVLEMVSETVGAEVASSVVLDCCIV
ncbi:MAG: hypothetical protein ACR2IJ_06020 [Fluviibacter sp.]